MGGAKLVPFPSAPGFQEQAELRPSEWPLPPRGTRPCLAAQLCLPCALQGVGGEELLLTARPALPSPSQIASTRKRRPTQTPVMSSWIQS